MQEFLSTLGKCISNCKECAEILEYGTLKKEVGVAADEQKNIEDDIKRAKEKLRTGALVGGGVAVTYNIYNGHVNLYNTQHVNCSLLLYNNYYPMVATAV